jgi:hypothetical protein
MAVASPVERSTSPPPFDFGGIGSSAWREEALTRAAELKGLADWIEFSLDDPKRHESQLAFKIGKQLESARQAAGQEDTAEGRWWSCMWLRFKRSLDGANFERTLGGLDAVEADLLRLAPDDYVRALMPSVKAHVNRYLPKDDPRRMRLEPLAGKAEKEALTPTERGAAVAAFHAANTQRRRDLLRLRTFRNVLLAAMLLLFVVAAGLGILGAYQPTLMPVCFTPDSKVVCPTEEMPLSAAAPGTAATEAQQGGGTATATASTADVDQAIDETVSSWDLGLVELIGLVAAAVASAFSLRKIRGTSTPYSLPVSLAGLKLATGALTAFLGLMLMRGNFVPGLSALDSSAQILAWAIVFGYSQQIFTRFVDRQAQSVLESVGGHGASGERPSPRENGHH